MSADDKYDALGQVEKAREGIFESIEQIKKDISTLLDWDCKDVRFSDKAYEFTNPNGNFVVAEEVHDTLEKTVRNGELYSCCDRIVDQDHMRCPKCHENV